MGDFIAHCTPLFSGLLGGGARTMGQLWFSFFPPCYLAASYLIHKARYLNAMTLGDETARHV